MADFLLLPGAGGSAWYWHRVVADLVARGHRALAVDFPADDPESGLPEYAAIAIAAADGLRDVVLVAQSMGGFTAPLVWPRIDCARVVFVNAMIPLPGETPGEWWGNVDSARAQREAAVAGGYSAEFDLDTYFFHDVPLEVLASGEPPPNEVERAFTDVCAFTLPDLPVHAVAGRDDRFFPVAFQQRLARDRLAIEADVLPGGHLIALSRPQAVADYLADLSAENR